jgi:hypothetical protein
MKEFDLVDIPKDQPARVVPLPKRKYSTWRFYNSKGELLYVSTRPNPAVLMKEDWWSTVAEAKIKHFTNADDMADDKAIAIYNEDPKWNSYGRRTDV